MTVYAKFTQISKIQVSQVMLDDLDDCVHQNQEKSQNQNDQGYLGYCVDQVYKR